jgi:hypothetical protein
LAVEVGNARVAQQAAPRQPFVIEQVQAAGKPRRLLK